MLRPSLLRCASVTAAVALAAAACGGTPPSPDTSRGTVPHPVATAPTTTVPAGTTNPYSSQATISLGLGAAPTNWNILARSAAPPAADSALATVADAVWPSAFVVGPSYVATRNDNLLVSAVQTSASPQTVVYQINGRATWSDGTEITGADFVYTWRAQSGQKGFRDKGGGAFSPESTDGYRSIRSVVTSSADPDRVVVTFKRPDADWQALFSPIIPAHVATTVGFDHGFTDPVTDLVSGGPFEVQSYQPGASMVLVRNPMWWGATANLASVTIAFGPSVGEAAASLMRGELDAAVTGLDKAAIALLQATPGIHVAVNQSATYDDLVINQCHGLLAHGRLRQAILLAVDRSALSRSAATLGDPGATIVANRAFLPGQYGYTDDTTSLGSTAGGAVASARRVLTGAGFHFRGARLYYRGRPVRLTLGVATDTPFAKAERAAVVSAGAALGVSLTTLPSTPAATDARVAAGRYDLAIVAARVAPFPSLLASTYGTAGADNVTGYSTRAMNSLLKRVQETAPGAYRRAATTAVDRLAWSDAVDLPLIARPSVLAYQSRYVNLVPDRGPAGVGWDIASWGIPART